MIFLFDKFKKLKGTVRNRHTISLLYERERNGLYTVSAEIPLKITDKKTVYNYHKKVQDSDFLGHYDREGRFQLHKIASVDIEGSSIFIKGVHLFFDEAKAGAIIQERRFRQSEIIDGARVAFDSIGWSVVDYDVSDTEDYIFYNVSPLEARAILAETFGFEFDYWLDFDGKNIRNKQISVKREMGKDSNKRYNYGHNVLNIKVEQDYSEIYTAVIGRGKGEDLGDDAYGRRIEYTDVEWKTPTHPMNKPKGSRVLHDENATQLFGYHEDGKVSPRTKVEIFEDIEEPAKLLRASYNWLRENSVPKAVFSLEVPDGDGLDLGDKVHVIYRDIDLVKHTRVTKVVDDLVSGNRDVEFGDTAYFKTDRRLSGVKSELKRVGGSMSSRISRLKAEFDKRFDDEVNQWHDDFEQAVIDAEAAVEVMRVTMTEEFEEAQRVMEEEFNQSVADAKKHADDAAEAKAKEVRDSLDSFKGEQEQIVEELQWNIIDFDGELEEARADVSGILGRLTGIDGSISGIEGSITGIQDSLAEVEGTLTNTKTQLETQISDARVDLEKSISNTRNELENKIDATENALNQVGEDLGNAKTDLQNQLDEARAELDGLEIGTRNLIPDSHFYSGAYNGWSNIYGTHVVEGHIWKKTYTRESGAARIERTFQGLDVGQTYTLTMYMKTDTDLRWSGFVAAELIDSSDTSASEEYKTYSVTFKVTSEETVFIRGYQSSAVEGSYIHMDWFTLVKGNVPTTDWIPAPEDTDNKITSINQAITNIEGELSSKVEQTEVDALKGTVTRQGTLLTQTADEVSSKAEKSVVDTLTGRVSNAESSVTQNANEIAKKLTKSVYDEDKKDTDAKITQWSNTASETAEGLTRVIGRVSQTEKGVETAQTRIEAEAGRIDGVLSRTSKVEGQVRDAQLAIEANADGLALRATKTEVEQAIDGIEVGGRNLAFKTSEPQEETTAAVRLRYDLNNEVLRNNIGKNITISFEAKFDSNKNFSAYIVQLPRDYVVNSTPISGGTESWKKFSFTGSIRSEAEFTTNAQFTLATSDYGAIRNLKVELGNKETDWTPAPEDIDASISEVTDRVTTAEAEIKVHAGEISQKASQSSLDRVTGRVSTAETSITQNANEIARRLVKSDYDTDKAKIDGDITKWSNLTTETAEGLAQSISRLSTAEGKVTKAQADIKANADEIATKVSNSQFDSLSGKVSDNSSAITQNANEIKSKVTQAEVDYSMTHIDNGNIKTVKDVASYYNSLSTVTGGILIKTNITGRAMSRVYIKGYNYATNNSNIDLVVSFYNYTTSILNHSYTSTGSKNIERVRLLRDSDGIVYILLNSFDSDWKYPAIVVDRFDMSYVTNWSWGEDWEITVIDSMPENIEYVTEVSGQDYGSIVTKHETDIIQNAEEIALKASQAELNRVTGRVSEAESELSVQAGEIELRATKSELDDVEGRVTATEASLRVANGQISSVVGRVAEAEFDISSVVQEVSSVVQDVSSITSTVTSLEDDVATQGSQITQNKDVIDSKVWLDDVANINPNLIPFTDVSAPESKPHWNNWGSGATNTWVDNLGYMNVDTTDTSTTVRIQSEEIDFVEGQEYTLSFLGRTSDNWNTREAFSYTFVLWPGSTTNQSLSSDNHIIENLSGRLSGLSRYTHTFTANHTGKARILLGTHKFRAGEYSRFSFKEPKLERGSERTPFLNAFSNIEQTANSIKLSVLGELDGGYVTKSEFDVTVEGIESRVAKIDGGGVLTQSDISVTSDSIIIGSQEISSNNLASIIAVSPRSIQAITDRMILNGDLYVDGDINALAVSAIKAEFADLFAARVKAGAVEAEYIEGFAGRFRSLYTLNANIERLVVQNVFTRKVKALSIEAVEADIGSIRSKILTSDVILSRHINSSNALIDKIFSSSARFERMMAKSAFVNTLNTVSLHANTFSSSYPGSNREITMENGRARFKYGSVVIENISGRRTIIDGQINRSQTMTPRMPRFQSSEVVEDGSWYRSSSTSYVIAHEEYFVHEARHIRVAMAVHMWGMSADCDGRMETRSGKISNYLSTNGESGAIYGWLKIDMGEPLDRPVSDSLIYTFKSRNSSQDKRMHLGNRFLTDFPENI